MMSQVELWNMQDYCNRRNSRRETRTLRARKTRAIYLLMILAGIFAGLCVPIYLAWSLW